MKKQTENATQNPSPTGGSGGPAPGALVTEALPRHAEISPVALAPGTDTDPLVQLLAENEQLKATIRFREAHRQITGELAKAGARSPELLFEAVKGELKFAVDGELKNAKALIESVTTRFPEQFGFDPPASIDAGAGTGGGNTLTREVLAKMKPPEIARLDWAEVRRVLADG